MKLGKLNGINHITTLLLRYRINNIEIHLHLRLGPILTYDMALIMLRPIPTYNKASIIFRPFPLTIWHQSYCHPLLTIWHQLYCHPLLTIWNQSYCHPLLTIWHQSCRGPFPHSTGRGLGGAQGGRSRSSNSPPGS